MDLENIMDIDTIAEEDAKKLIKKLVQEIKEYDIAYYHEDAPKISDAEYDQLFFALKNLEESDDWYRICGIHGNTFKPNDPEVGSKETKSKTKAKKGKVPPQLQAYVKGRGKKDESK